jgi:hypothetical protein
LNAVGGSAGRLALPRVRCNSAIHLAGRALELSYLMSRNEALVPHRYTTTESFHKNMLATNILAGDAAIRAHAGCACDDPDRSSLARVVLLTPGLA